MDQYYNQYDAAIHIPALTSYFISRDRLKEITKEKRITILQAEAGMGKTIFLTTAAHHFEGKCVWCDMEAAGNTLSGFAALMENAIRVADPEFSFGIDTKDMSIDEVVFSLIRGLNQLARGPLLLVLDNAQEFNCSGAAVLFSALFKGLNSDVRIMIATKGEFPLPLASYQAKGLVCVINRNLLCFYHEEIAELLKKMTGISDQNDLVEEILVYTEGWPLAVMLILMRLQQLGYPILGSQIIQKEQKALSLNNLLKDMQMYQYIASEVFGKMDYGLQQFLLTTCVLDQMDPETCNYLTRQKNSAQILEYLASHNLFTSRVPGKREWYRYHSVLQDFLRERISSEQCAAIFKKAALYYMSIHDFIQGTAYAVKAADENIIIQSLENYGAELLQNGQLEILGNWAKLLTTTDWTGHIPELTVRSYYLISRYYLYSGKEKEAVDFLNSSCRKALEQKEKRFFSHYFYELDDDLEKLEQDALKRRILQVFMDAEVQPYDWMKDKYSRTLLKKWTECSLCLNIHEQIRAFYNKAMAIPEYRGSDMCMVHRLLIDTLQNRLTEEEILAAARNVRTYSVILSDFGYFTYISTAYRNNRKDLISEAMGDLDCCEEENCFYIKCRIYYLLTMYENGISDGDKVRQELIGLRRKLQEQNYQIPFLKPEDRKKFYGILKINISVPEEKYPSAESPILRVLCMDGLQVLTADGTPLIWRTKKAKELFFRLFAMLGKSCDKPALMEDLWPEGERDKVSALFDTTLSYMKKSLKTVGAESILLSAKRSYSLDMRLVSSDLMDLLNILNRYEKQEWLPEESPALIRKLYRQGLLNGVDYMWAAFEQEHLERRVMNGLSMLAGHLYMKGDYQGSIETAHLALDINPFNESLVRILVDSYITDGQIGKAKKMQAYYSRLWSEELGERLEFAEMLTG